MVFKLKPCEWIYLGETQMEEIRQKKDETKRVGKNDPGTLLQTKVSYLGVDSLPSSMAPHSSTLAWKIPWTKEPGGLQSMGLLTVRHNWVTSLSLFTFMHWRRKWQPTPVFLPGESQGRGILVGCHLWGRTESDMTEVIQQQQQGTQSMHRGTSQAGDSGRPGL